MTTETKLTEKELKQWLLRTSNEDSDRAKDFLRYISESENEIEYLEKSLNLSFKFDESKRKELKKEYSETEIREAELHTEYLMKQMEWNEWKKKHLQKSTVSFDFSMLDWKNLDEYRMLDMIKSLGLNEKEAYIFDSIWTIYNTQYHVGHDKFGNERIIPISDMTHYLALKSLRTNVKLVEKSKTFKYFKFEVSQNLLDEAYKVLNDKDILSKYDIEWKKKQDGIAKRVKNHSKKIKDLRTGIVYESAIDCANAIGKSKSYISKHKDRFQEVK